MRNLKNKEEESLLEMLMFARIPKLPDLKEESDNRIWVRAIVKILRKSGYCDYTIAYHDYHSWNEVNVIKELAGMGVASDVVGIYPYEFLQDRYIPNVKTKEDIVKYVASVTHDDEEYLNGMPNEILKKLLFNICIKEQIHRTKEIEEMKQYKLAPLDYGLNFMDSKGEEVVVEEDKVEEEPHGEPTDNPEEEVDVQAEVINENIEENGEDGRNDGRKPVGRPKKRVEE